MKELANLISKREELKKQDLGFSDEVMVLNKVIKIREGLLTKQVLYLAEQFCIRENFIGENVTYKRSSALSQYFKDLYNQQGIKVVWFSDPVYPELRVVINDSIHYYLDIKVKVAKKINFDYGAYIYVFVKYEYPKVELKLNDEYTKLVQELYDKMNKANIELADAYEPTRDYLKDINEKNNINLCTGYPYVNFFSSL